MATAVPRDSIIICNPCIRRFVSVTLPRRRVFLSCLAFGFDSRNRDYKVGLLYWYCNTSPEVELYSLATGLWRNLHAIAPVVGAFVDLDASHGFVNGLPNAGGVMVGTVLFCPFILRMSCFVRFCHLTAWLVPPRINLASLLLEVPMERLLLCAI
ncbi:F-box/kelch-repeat protein [Spatholobus suberectus]|nr:F-box/kelch-repeat protein [Spatholobus suberectus]